MLLLGQLPELTIDPPQGLHSLAQAYPSDLPHIGQHHQLVDIAADALELMSKLFQSVNHHYPVPQGGGADIGSGGHMGRLRLGLDDFILLRRHPERDPFFFLLFHSYLRLFASRQTRAQRSGSRLERRQCVMNEFSALAGNE